MHDEVDTQLVARTVGALVGALDQAANVPFSHTLGTRVVNGLLRAWRVLRKRGLRVALAKIAARVSLVAADRPMLLDRADVLAVDWRRPPPWESAPRALGSGPLTVGWILSPPGANSGGHQNIFRFIRFLEEAGHRCRIFVYSAVDPTTLAEAQRRVDESSSYAPVQARLEQYPAGGVSDDVDVLFATGWETAYRSFLDPSNARRLYFVQDFEPLFYPAGSEAIFAENTYRFGFSAITAGEWLAHRLRTDYGMRATSFAFGADSENYRITNSERRSGVFFYARPETPRRGYELGLLALELVAKERPQYSIILAGQSLRGYTIPFPHENPGNVHAVDLNGLYNRCAAGLVVSLTNLSLLPLELMSAGVIPVVNDGPNSRMVSNNPYIAFTEPSPRALADALIAIVDRVDQVSYAAEAARSLGSGGWTEAGREFVKAFEQSVKTVGPADRA